MDALQLTHLAVYADREHFANLAWLTGFDPRFEEALLLLAADPGRDPLLLVGNECVSYLRISPLYPAGRLRHERYQPFSLPDQPMDASRELTDILRGEALGVTGVVDWKPGRFAAPHWIVEALRQTTVSLVPATDLVHRLRARASAAEIAYFEWTNTLASDAIRRILFSLRDGALDHDLMRLAEYNGEPQGCHWGMKSGTHRVSLASPRGGIVQRGAPFSVNVCYWGANICRAGWAVAEEAELPAEASGYVEEFAGPYFEASVEWLESLHCGADAGAIARRLLARLPFERFGIFLNPGHLIHLDEWYASPFYPASTESLASGMVIQSDIIPGVPRFFSTRMEDGYALADRELQSQLRDQYPDVSHRCQQRREWMRSKLAISLHRDVLPLSNVGGLVPPFFLTPRRVFAGPTI